MTDSSFKTTIEELNKILKTNSVIGEPIETIKKLENEQEAALAFMKCYERGLPQSNYVRQQYATIAYEYFVQ